MTATRLSKEQLLSRKKQWKILLYACSLGMGLEIEHIDNEEEFSPEIEWALFIKMARYHKVVPLVFKGFSSSKNTIFVPEEIKLRLKERANSAAIRNLMNTREMVRLGRMFDENRIPYIPFKGTILSNMIYEDIGIRESSDIDVIVKKEDFGKIESLLFDHGYVNEVSVPKVLKRLYLDINSEYNYDKYEKDGSRMFHIEPHRYLGTKMFQAAIPYDQVIPFTKRQNLFGCDMAVLDTQGLLLTTAVHHGYSDRWNHLKNVCDLAALMHARKDELDWAEILNTVDRLKIRSLLLPGLYLAHKCFGVELPNLVGDQLEKRHINLVQHRIDITYLECVKGSGVKHFFSKILHHLKTRDHFSTKLWIVFYHFIHAVIRPFVKKEERSYL